MSAALLQRFEPGLQYDVDDSLGGVFLSEGWAETVASKEPALLIPLRKLFLTSDAELAADVAFDDAIAAAILRRPQRHE